MNRTNQGDIFDQVAAEAATRDHRAFLDNVMAWSAANIHPYAGPFLINLVVTWGIGLLPPLAIRFLFLKRPLGKTPAMVISGIFWAVNVILFTALGSQRHGALVLVAYVSYLILRKEGKGERSASMTSQALLNFRKLIPGEKRKTILASTAGVIVLMMLFPPYHVILEGGRVVGRGYGFLFTPPHYGDTVNIGLLFAQWVMACIVGGVAFWLTKDAHLQAPRKACTMAANGFGPRLVG